MVFNVTQGSTVQVIVEYRDASGNLVVPSSATLVMTYTAISGTSASSTIAMSQSNSVFTANWESAQAALGNAAILVTAPGQPSKSDLLRLLNPST